MRGSSHIIMNIATAGTIGCTLYFMFRNNTIAFLHGAADASIEFLFDGHFFNGDKILFIYFPAVVLLYLLGSLLPDIDHPHSAIGKIIHIPIKHRTWLHAIYIPLILFIVSIWFRPVFYLGIGYFFHIFWDMFSATGIDWFYPKKNKHHILKLYKTSQLSEGVFVGISVTLSVLYCVFLLFAVPSLYIVY